MADNNINPIKIFKGDDTDFNGGKWLTINLTTDLDLTGFIGVFTLDKFKVTKSAASKSIDLVIPRSFTSKMAVGEYAGTFQLIDTNGRYLTVTNTIPFQVTQEVFTPQGDEINLQVPENYPVEISLSISGGAVDYDKLANLPTFNGKEWKGALTFESENIASKSELNALAGKVNTNKNDIDGLGDQIHEVEAKIPQAASDSNQLVDKASMTSALAGKQDKGQYATEQQLSAGLQTKQNAFTVGDGLKMEDNVLSATGGAVESVNGKTGVVVLTASDVGAAKQTDMDDLGDQVSEIEAKIPAEATTANQLADKEFVTTITDELAADITALDADVQNINLIKWVQALPATGETKYLYAIPREETDKDGNKIAALYLWDGTEWRGAGAFSLNIDPDTLATKNELAGYLPLSGGTLSGNLHFPRAYSDRYSIQNGYNVSSFENPYLIFGNNACTSLLDTRDEHIKFRKRSTGNTQYELLSVLDKAVANGVASLDENAKVPVNQLPDTVINTTDDGIKGDYCSTYGILDSPNGVLTASGMKLTLKAGLVLQCAGQEAKTTIAGDTVHEVESTADFDLFYADGAFYEATQVVWSKTEPENGDTGIVAWWNPDAGKWKFKSNAAGNVWATADKAARLAHIHTDGTTITRIDYIGTRVLDEGRLLQGLKKTVADLAADADSAAIIAKVNEILAALREAGVLS